MSVDLPKWFRAAKKASEKSDHHTFKIGAAIFNKKSLIAVGYNMVYKTHPYTRMYSEHQTLHAEVAALLHVKYRKDLSNCVMVTFRQLKNGQLALAKPCETCQKIMKDFGIKRMAYTINDGYTVEELK